MSDSVLRTHIRDLRRVLGEDRVETVVGRGYRFLVEVTGGTPATAPDTTISAPAIAGREDKLQILANVLREGNHLDYATFVQSTSNNRKLVRGTTLLYQQ